MFFQAGLLVFLVFLTSYGNAAFATYGIGLSILGLMIVVAYSFSISSAILVSQHLGAGDKQGAYDAAKKTARTSVYLMIVGGAVISLFAEEIARFMIDDPEVISLMELKRTLWPGYWKRYWRHDYCRWFSCSMGRWRAVL